MSRLFLLPLLLVCAAASAEVYKHVSPDGRVTFSDQPAPGAEEVHVPPLQTFDMGPVPKSTVEPKTAKNKKKFDYSELAILSPENGQGIRANDGTITVKMAVKPSLGPGHTIKVTLDGEPVASGRSTSLKLKNLPRGGHTLKAIVIDEEGDEVRKSDPVLFFLHRVAGG